MNMVSVYGQSGIHMHVHSQVILVIRYNPTVLVFVDINEAPKLYWHYTETGICGRYRVGAAR